MAKFDGINVEQVYIKVGGRDVDKAVQRDLVSVEVDSSFDVPDMFAISLRDDDLEWLDGSIFGIGKEVEIAFEMGDVKGTVIKGEITSLEPEYQDTYSALLTIRGYDKRHRLNRGTASAAYNSVMDKDLAQKVAAAAGLSFVSDTTSGGQHQHIFQANENKMAYLQQLARANGFEIYYDDGKVYFKKGETSRNALVKLEWGAELLSFMPRASAVGQVNEVNVRGWDIKKKQSIIGKATSSTVEPNINLGGSGGTVAKKAFGAATYVEVRRPVATQKEADALAQGILDEINAGFVEARGVCDGNPKLVSGVQIELSNLGSKFSGKYVVTSARHVYSTERYYTEFEVAGMRPRLVSEMIAGASISAPEIQRWPGVVPAIVTNVADPDDMGRVKLKFPWLDDALESNWARVTMMGSGQSRGFHWLPEVNDEVLVTFEQGDFNYPYVLGNLYNGKDKVPDPKKHQQSGKIEQRTLKTRAGHLLRFTDKAGEEKIEIIDGKSNTSIVFDQVEKTITVTSKGKVIINTDAETEVNAKKNVTVKSNADVAIDAKGKADVTAGGNATIKASGNMTIQASGSLTLKGNAVTIQAQAGFTLKGNSPSTVQSSAILNLKGSTVNIN